MKRKIINGIPEATEHEIQNSILSWLAYKGYYAMRMNTGMVENKYGGRIRMAPAGTPDIIAFKGMYPSGNITMETSQWQVKHKPVDLLFIEVKRKGNKPTMLQEAKMKELEEYGARCIVATSIEDLEEELK